MTAATATLARDDALAHGLAQLEVPLASGTHAAIERYLALLAKWNRTYNLTAIRDPQQMIVQHALDALAVLPHIPDTPGARVLDVGTGGGIPGILFALARPHWQVTLLDVVQKKAAFLTQAVIELQLPNVAVAISRVEDYSPPAPFDIIVSRAFAELATFVRGSVHLLAPSGQWFAMKGLLPADEIAALPAGVHMVSAIPVTVPGLDAARHLIHLEPDRA